MSKYYSIYCNILKGTEMTVKNYSPHLNLNHLKLPKNANEELLIKSFKKLENILKYPHLFYLKKR